MTLLDRMRAAFPGYEIGNESGRGTSGIVVDGHHRQLRRDVAIKQVPAALVADPGVRTRFEEEARTLASLDHPHIVPVYDFVSEDGFCALVMEKLPGGTVWGRFASEGLSPEDACAVTLAALSALDCAHRQGILHRDIKPDNLMFSSSGTVKVTDFGIAMAIGGLAVNGGSGEAVGTPAYMAPEQVLGGDATPACDVYSSAVMLYELLAGVLPFCPVGESTAVMYRHVTDQPVPLGTAAPELPSAIADVVMRALAPDPAARYSSARDFGRALTAATADAWGPGWLNRSSIPVMAGGEGVVAVSGEAASARPTTSTAGIDPVTLDAPAATGRRRLFTFAAAMGVALVLLVCFGIFAERSAGNSHGNVSAGTAAVGSAMPTGDSSVEIDLAQPVVVTGRSRSGGIQRVGMSYSVLDDLIERGGPTRPWILTPPGIAVLLMCAALGAGCGAVIAVAVVRFGSRVPGSGRDRSLRPRA